MNEIEKKNPEYSKSGAILKIILLIIYIITLFLIYNFFIIFEKNLFIGLLLIAFSLLIFIGPLFKIRKTKRFYNQLFPNRNEKIKKKYEKKREEEKRKKDFLFYKKKITHPVNLDYTYQKSVIRKCYNCGIIIPQFVKRCPNCGAALE